MHLLVVLVFVFSTIINSVVTESCSDISNPLPITIGLKPSSIKINESLIPSSSDQCSLQFTMDVAYVTTTYHVFKGKSVSRLYTVNITCKQFKDTVAVGDATLVQFIHENIYWPFTIKVAMTLYENQNASFSDSQRFSFIPLDVLDAISISVESPEMYNMYISIDTSCQNTTICKKTISTALPVVSSTPVVLSTAMVSTSTESQTGPPNQSVAWKDIAITFLVLMVPSVIGNFLLLFSWLRKRRQNPHRQPKSMSSGRPNSELTDLNSNGLSGVTSSTRTSGISQHSSNRTSGLSQQSFVSNRTNRSNTSNIPAPPKILPPKPPSEVDDKEEQSIDYETPNNQSVRM